jgi:hypothetical protein
MVKWLADTSLKDQSNKRLLMQIVERSTSGVMQTKLILKQNGQKLKLLDDL